MKFLFLLIFIQYSIKLYGGEIQNYQPCFGVYIAGENNYPEFVLRKYTLNEKEYIFLVNSHSLRTSINESMYIKYTEKNLPEIKLIYKKTNYIKALLYADEKATSTQNAGITHFFYTQNGVILTADLCPSNRPLDKNLFESIIEEFSFLKKPIPVALCVSGLWINNHRSDIKWLKHLQETQLFSITWINHSYYHKTDNKIDIEKNFLLIPGININFEILNTEKKMIESGIVPSVFFRFPGLTSNEKLYKKITGYGLIPIGSDAWLAKNQKPENGSIILVHANGNEPDGIQRFLDMIKNKRDSILKKNWALHDLRDSIIKEE